MTRPSVSPHRQEFWLRILFIASFAVSVVFVGAGRAQSTFRVLPSDFNADKQQQMMRAYLRRLAHQALDRRLAELETSLAAPESFSAYQAKRRAFLKWTMGPMPPRTPLHARTTGVLNEDGYTIEKVMFESRPGFHVTANVYRPQGMGPFPAILHPVGHTEDGKAAGAYQRANQLLVRHGFLVLCYDPIGQGERKQILNDQGKPTHRASGEHQQLGAAPILLGQGFGSWMLWDGVRALDYLCSREDVDKERIGCTGNSGGGNMTSYLMAYDSRIAAAAPGCFVTTHRRKNEKPGPGDAEQNLYAQIRDGFDHPDFVLTRAPKPTLILAATYDFVPIEGAWEAFRQSKRAYTLLGYPERVALIEAAEKHGFSQRLREGVVRFFARWLQGRELTAFEDSEPRLRKEVELQVTAQGQVRWLPNERSIFDLFAEEERTLRQERPQVTAKIVRQITGVRPLNVLPRPTVSVISDAPPESNSPQKLVLRPEAGIVLAALFWLKGKRAPVVLAPSDGINAAVEKAERLQADGHPVLIVEVRDTGESKTRNWRFAGADYYIAHMLGRCWLGMRCEDLLVSARWLREQCKAESVQIYADGELGPAALHAAALESSLVETVHVQQSLKSWRELMTATDAHKHLHNAVHGALRHYDLPDLESLRSEGSE